MFVWLERYIKYQDSMCEILSSMKGVNFIINVGKMKKIMSAERKPSIDVALFSVLAILAISLFLQHEFALKQSLLFLIGVGLGISLLHALFGPSLSYGVCKDFC